MGLSGEWVLAITHAIYEAVLRLKKEACEGGMYGLELDNSAFAMKKVLAGDMTRMTLVRSGNQNSRSWRRRRLKRGKAIGRGNCEG